MTAFWLIAFIALAAGEAVTVGLVCIWFAAGALGVLGAFVWVSCGVWEGAEDGSGVGAGEGSSGAAGGVSGACTGSVEAAAASGSGD